MPKVSDLVHASRLEVTFLDDGVSQSVGGRRNVSTTQCWKRGRKLGQGGFGTVYLERCEAEGKVRAVKQLAKAGGLDLNRELEAAALFSQRLVSFLAFAIVTELTLEQYRDSFVESFGW